MATNRDRDPAPRLRLLVGILIGLAAGYAVGLFTVNVPTVSAPAQDTVEAGPAAVPVNPELEEELMALGYAAGSALAPDVSGVTVYERGATHDAYNLFTSGDKPGATLMDMEGRILHEWKASFFDIWPDIDPGEEYINYWRRVYPFENGDVIAIIESEGIFRLDKDSNVIWENHCGAHHDMVVDDSGHIFVLTREKRMVDLEDGIGIRPVLEDSLVELDPDGKELRRVSLLDAMRRTSYEPLIMDAPPHWDIFHTNSVKRIREGHAAALPAFQPGRFLLSIRELSTVAVLDFEGAKIVWALKGKWLSQHEAILLDSGNILLFDNNGNHRRSKVIEFDPRTQETVWTYGSDDDQPLDSPLCGLAQRLPNGNTLINEAVPGRVIEVTPHGTIVWEFINPNRTDQDDEIIASVMDFIRLPWEYEPGSVEWLSKPSD